MSRSLNSKEIYKISDKGSMKNNQDPNLKHYFKEITYFVFETLIKEVISKDNTKPITVWEKGEDESRAEYYIPTGLISDEKRLRLMPTGSLVTKIAGSNKANKDVYVKIQMNDRTHLFTVAKLIFHKVDLTYSLIFGEIIYQSQKRGSYRLTASKIVPVQFKIDNQVFEAYDISAGGTSFVVDEVDKSRFPIGSNFDNCTIRFDRKNYHIPKIKIAGHFPLIEQNNERPGAVKIGISFIDLPKSVEEELEIKISTEARGMEMKNKFDVLLNKKKKTEEEAS